MTSASVVIAAFSSDRWDYLRDAVSSVAAQSKPALETIVVIDHNPDLLARARRELPGAVVIPNTGARGASGARNTGVARSCGEIAVFLDDDACATVDWLENLLACFAYPGVVGAGDHRDRGRRAASGRGGERRRAVRARQAESSRPP